MRFACLGSGSRGNAWLVEAGDTRVLLDCGFGVRETASRLARLGLQPAQLAGILLSHEHGDHVAGAAPFAEKHGIPLYLSDGCRAALPILATRQLRVHVVRAGHSFALGDLEISPYAVPHDAREPVQYVLGDGARRFGLLSDAGQVEPAMVAALSGCDALAVECNHDEERLRRGRYHPALKARILGPRGHLANTAAGRLLAALDGRRLQHVVAIHLSAENNTPELAREALAGALGCAPEWIGVADQRIGLEWRAIT